MIPDNQIDELFSDRLRDYPSSVPADMWNRIVEKKKRDRMFWLFFFGLFALLILSLGLTAGYFIFKQKKLTSSVVADSMKMNHAPIVTDTLNMGQSNLPSRQNQTGLDKMVSKNKKMHPREKAEMTYSGTSEHVQRNTTGKVNSSSSEIRPEVLPVSIDSIEIEKNKAADKKDSTEVKNFVKATPRDSSNTTDSKKPGKQMKPTNGKWFLDLYASPDYPIVTPHQNEKPRLSFSVGLKINRSFGKHFSVKTGIQFSQVNIVANDSSLGNKPFHLKRLDLPVLVGYSVGDDRFRTTFNGGAILNFYTWFHSEYMSNIFKSRTGLSLYLGVNFERRIKERFFLFTEPYYRYQLTSMTVSSVSSMKFIDVMGINLGARYYFKK